MRAFSPWRNVAWHGHPGMRSSTLRGSAIPRFQAEYFCNGTARPSIHVRSWSSRTDLPTHLWLGRPQLERELKALQHDVTALPDHDWTDLVTRSNKLLDAQPPLKLFLSQGETLPAPVWARQVLPNVRDFSNPPSEILPEIAKYLREKELHKHKWRLVVLGDQRIERNLLESAKLVCPEILSKNEQSQTFAGQQLVQLAVPDARRKSNIFVSIHPLTQHPTLGWNFPLPAKYGVVSVKLRLTLPSRAYAKLDEALRHLGTSPIEGNTCVDLGSSPGGWTEFLLAAGATVTSVDKAPLSVRQSSRLTTIKGDGIVWKPPKKVDWVFNDMAIPPEKSVGVLAEWIRNEHCDRFVWTLKFTGEDYAAIDKTFATLRELPVDFLVRHLARHGNEVIIMGRVRQS